MTETGSSTTTASICTLAYKFTGKERDAESGLDYFGARYYSSSTGRFMSPDWSAQEEPVPYAKLGNPQTLNLYGYMQNNPLGGVDQHGHWEIARCGIMSPELWEESSMSFPKQSI
ncbi:RHS repeat-associated core domain-containing protein [Tunturiibacter gelidiferens]|uniref:RHS repeat-associated core domain-containing protein n=1 Tax=Tunturiibacter gelidiferens TaxID=3069689 RepID=A0AAU7YZQ5_9BACT